MFGPLGSTPNEQGLRATKKTTTICQVACSETQSYRAQYELIRPKLKKKGLRAHLNQFRPITQICITTS